MGEGVSGGELDEGGVLDPVALRLEPAPLGPPPFVSEFMNRAAAAEILPLSLRNLM